jgi:hypothetical protein
MTTRRRGNTPAGPVRLADGSAGDATRERAGRLLREVREPPPPHPAQDARIDQRVSALWRPQVQVAPRRRWAVAIAGAATVLLLGGAVAAKYNPAPLRRLLAALRPSPAPVAPRPRPPAAAPPAVTAPPAAVTPPAPVAPPPAAAPAPRPARERVRRTRHDGRHDGRPGTRSAPGVRRLSHAAAPAGDGHVAPAAAQPPGQAVATRTEAPQPEAPPPKPPPPPSALGSEAQLLGRALAQLRRDGDPAGALATLDEYEARFPRGAMAFDALAARAETLVKLGREQAALARLDAVPGAALAKSPALRVLRGELRASAGRLDDAIADFDRALGRGGAARGDLGERALYGRGSCRARRGDERGARDDLERYLQLHPRGRFAAEARRALGR